jgi:predicted esterase
LRTCASPWARYKGVILRIFAHIFSIILALCLWSAGASAKESPYEPQMLDVPGAPNAFYVKPTGKGRRPIIMYLHGRGANPQEDCRKWARVAARFGWVICPQGAEDRGGGSRAWANSSESARQIMNATVDALKAKFKGRVQARNNILIGFSEGAFVAQQVGLKEPSRWSRWLILAASDKYWVGDVQKELTDAKAHLRRVYLLTGESDSVMENTKSVGELLHKAHIRTKVRIVPNMGHEVPGDKMLVNYRRPLLWLSAAK